MAQVSISGAVSGIDTASLVNQLVTAQGMQQNLLKARQTGAQKSADAYKSLAASLTDLATRAKALAQTSAWQGVTGTSSSTSVTVKATGTTPGALTFDVVQTAKAHSVTFDPADPLPGALTDVVAGSQLTLTKHDGSTVPIDVGTGTLSDVVAGINRSGQSLVASAVKDSSGSYRLEIAAARTGDTSQFSLSGFSGFTAVDKVVGQDAKITVDAGTPFAFDVTSATNTFTDVVPGLAVTVTKAETGVTVRSTVDGGAVADGISALVDKANQLLADIAAKSAYDKTTKTLGPLGGEFAVRSLQQSLLGLVSGASTPGVSLTRDGKLAFDRAAFTSAFAADPAAVAQAYGLTASFSPAAGVSGGIGVAKASPNVRNGSYAVTVTTAPSKEQWTLATGGSIAGSTVHLARGTTTVSYTAGAGETLADSRTALAAKVAPLGLDVAVNGTDLVLTARAEGTAAAFTADLDGVAGTRVAGKDVAGTIGGQAATGSGRLLTLTSGTGGAVGLSLAVGVTAADVTASGGAVGTFDYRAGLAQRIGALLDEAVGTTGSVTRAQKSRLDAVAGFQKQIDGWDERLTTYRQMLTRQFTAMETAIATLRTQTSFLTAASTSSSSSGN